MLTGFLPYWFTKCYAIIRLCHSTALCLLSVLLFSCRSMLRWIAVIILPLTGCGRWEIRTHPFVWHVNSLCVHVCWLWSVTSQIYQLAGRWPNKNQCISCVHLVYHWYSTVVVSTATPVCSLKLSCIYVAKGCFLYVNDAHAFQCRVLSQLTADVFWSMFILADTWKLTFMLLHGY